MSHSHNAENDELTTEKTKSKAGHKLKKSRILENWNRLRLLCLILTILISNAITNLLSISKGM